MSVLSDYNLALNKGMISLSSRMYLKKMIAKFLAAVKLLWLILDFLQSNVFIWRSTGECDVKDFDPNILKMTDLQEDKGVNILSFLLMVIVGCYGIY